MTPGTTATVTATLVNDGDYAMPQAGSRSSAPAGWTVSRPAPGHRRARARRSPSSFTVTVPANAQPGTSTLHASRSRPAAGGPPASVEASATVAVPYASLAAAYNNTGISDNSDEAAANYDGVGDSFSAQALAAGTPTALTPGGQVTIGGTTFTWPDVAAGTPDNVVAAGQTVALSGLRDRPRIPRRQPERHRQRHRHRQLHRRQQPVVQPQHGGLVRQQSRRSATSS